MTHGRIGEAALLVGYAMSRLDRRALEILAVPTWDAAFVKAGQILGERPKSIKALRDEFDPFFANSRRGWADRPMRAPLVALLHEMEGVSSGALEALLLDALAGRTVAIEAIHEVLAAPPRRLADVGQRLRTGAMAERFFLDNCRSLVDVSPDDVQDARLDACGYDFARRSARAPVFEVKGLAGGEGGLLFTDLEWQTARRLAGDYLVVVVSDLGSSPRATVVADPVGVLPARMVTEQRLVISWHSHFASGVQ